MKTDMKELEDQAAANARSAQAEKQHSLQLERDLKTLTAELEQLKKESEAAKRTAQKAHNDLKAVFDTCRKGIGAMCQHIFGEYYVFRLLLLHFDLRNSTLTLVNSFVLQELTPQNSNCPPASNSMKCWTIAMGCKKELVLW